MIYFSSLPEPLSSVGASLCVTLADITATSADLRIYANDGRLLGTKRIVGQSEATIDIAPILRRAVTFTPTSGATGFFAATERQISVRFEAESGGALITTAARTYFVSADAVVAPACCTTGRKERLLATDEWDELTFLTNGAMTITITAEGRNAVEAEQYKTYLSGVAHFRLAAADFPDAHLITVDAGDYGIFRYTIVAPIEGSVRLAWRNAVGGVEHYTFPQVDRELISVERQRCCSEEGYRTLTAKAEEQWTLRSAYEMAETMRSLVELLTAEQVWRITADGYEAVEVVNDEAEIEHHGILQQLPIMIRSTQKNGRLWS